MISRRRFIASGMSAAALGFLRGSGLAWPAEADPTVLGASGTPSRSTGPIHIVKNLQHSIMVDGFPFAPSFTGDPWNASDIPFHTCQNCFENGNPPAPTEEVNVAVVGGGISGLATAYMLRDHDPVLFELRSRCGGNAMGEYWAGTYYSLGNAYVITPDKGSFLEDFYKQLGLDKVYRLSEGGEDPIELGGKILLDFWKGGAKSSEEQKAYQRYAEIVTQMAEKDYPEIPLPKGKDNQWIIDLDGKSLRQDIEEQMGMPVPPLLAGAIQAYCYSSFGGGWEEISAAGGWNFLAAEEYGRWVFPGGTTYMADAIWRRLAKLEDSSRRGGPPHVVRSNARVVDVRLAPMDRVLVTYRDPGGTFRSLLAKRVVMCCPKMVAKYLIHDLDSIDPAKFYAMQNLEYRAYVVANVLLDAPIDVDFYDVFLMRDGNFPTNDGEAEKRSAVIDMLNGYFARQTNVPRSVLTLYWPLPYATARFSLIDENAWPNYAAALAPQIRYMLDVLKVSYDAVRQVRMTRWGHAMPLNRVGMIGAGLIEKIRRPVEDRIYFVNQDNWALPAVENCLLDAENFVPQVIKGL